jgi:hypothetical protein
VFKNSKNRDRAPIRKNRDRAPIICHPPPLDPLPLGEGKQIDFIFSRDMEEVDIFFIFSPRAMRK